MNQRDDLLAAVLDTPEDDAPRLVLADWLEENGEGRQAEFIRLSLPLANPKSWSKSRIGKKRRREAHGRWADFAYKHVHTFFPWLNLRQGHNWIARDLYEAGEWSAALANASVRPGSSEVLWRRGLIESITCPSALWLSHAAKLTATCPIREVWLTDEPPHYDGDIMAHIVPQYTPRFDMQAFRRDYGRYQLTRNWPKIAFHFPERSGVTIDPIHPDPDDERLFRPTRPFSTRRR